MLSTMLSEVILGCFFGLFTLAVVPFLVLLLVVASPPGALRFFPSINPQTFFPAVLYSFVFALGSKGGSCSIKVRLCGGIPFMVCSPTKRTLPLALPVRTLTLVPLVYCSYRRTRIMVILL